MALRGQELTQNGQYRPIRQVWQHPLQYRQWQRHAAFRRRQPGPGGMQKDGAATAAPSWPQIEIQHHNKIIEMIRPLHHLVACRIGQIDRPIVVAVMDSIAPATALPNPREHERCGTQMHMIGPVPAAHQPHGTQRRCSIAFAFQCLDATFSQCANMGLSGEAEQALGFLARPAPHKDVTQSVMHCWSFPLTAARNS